MLNKWKGLQRSLNIHQKRGQQAGFVLSKSRCIKVWSALWDPRRRGEAREMLPARRLPQPVPSRCRNGRWVLLLLHPGNTDSSGRRKFHLDGNLKYVYRELRQADPSLICRRLKSPKHVPCRLAQPDPEFIYLCILYLQGIFNIYIFYCNWKKMTKENPSNPHIPHSFKKNPQAQFQYI